MTYKYQFKKMSKIYIGLILLIISNSTFASPLEDFRLFQGTIKVVDISGNPLSNIAVYGLCKNLHLIWPRTPDNQYTEAWKQNYFAKTNSKGIVNVEVPRGEWEFYGSGLTKNNQVLCDSVSVDVNKDFLITIAPETLISASYGLSSKNQIDSNCLLSKLYITQSQALLYIQIPIEQTNNIIFQSKLNHAFYIWGSGYTEDNKTAYVANFGNFKEGWNRPSSLNQIVFEGKNISPFAIKWNRRWHEGLSDTIEIKTGQKFIVSNGEFSIGYKRKISDIWCDFVSKWYDFSGAEKRSLTLNDRVRMNLWTQNRNEESLVQLFLIDDNGHYVKQLFDKKGNPLEFHATLKEGGKILKGNPYPRNMSFVFADYKLTGKETWNFSIPLESIKNEWFSKTSFVEPSGKFFTMKIPADLTNYAVNYLEQLDQFSIKMQRICGRKKQIHRTQLLLNIESTTSGELHGRNIATANHVIFSDFPIQSHSFPHEMAHNFGFTHGGLQETVVEVTRSASAFIIYGQESKWLFIDRMNDRKRNESWYPYTSLYLWGYSQEGPRFLHLLSRFEPTLLNEGQKKGFSKEEITAAMFCAFLNRDMYEISSKYGLCKDKVRYKESLEFVKRYLAAYEI